MPFCLFLATIFRCCSNDFRRCANPISVLVSAIQRPLRRVCHIHPFPLLHPTFSVPYGWRAGLQVKELWTSQANPDELRRVTEALIKGMAFLPGTGLISRFHV
jgi:hypothetical protein